MMIAKSQNKWDKEPSRQHKKVYMDGDFSRNEWIEWKFQRNCGSRYAIATADTSTSNQWQAHNIDREKLFNGSSLTI